MASSSVSPSLFPLDKWQTQKKIKYLHFVWKIYWLSWIFFCWLAFDENYYLFIDYHVNKNATISSWCPHKKRNFFTVFVIFSIFRLFYMEIRWKCFYKRIYQLCWWVYKWFLPFLIPLNIFILLGTGISQEDSQIYLWFEWKCNFFSWTETSTLDRNENEKKKNWYFQIDCEEGNSVRVYVHVHTYNSDCTMHNAQWTFVVVDQSIAIQCRRSICIRFLVFPHW